MRAQDVLENIYIHAGDYLFSARNIHVHTALGSCVSITLWHPERKLGGICHFALPRNPHPSSLNPRYGDDCIKLFLKSCEQRHTPITEYEVKVFGGSDVIQKYPYRLPSLQNCAVGEANCRAAFRYLMAVNANIVSADIGEKGYRKIVFDIFTGDVWVKFKSLI